MGILRDGMSIQCRTKEERDIFFEVAAKEGYLWNGCGHLDPELARVKSSFQLGYINKHRVTHGTLDSQYGTLVNIEASQLFRNLLISRRAKNGHIEKRN